MGTGAAPLFARVVQYRDEAGDVRDVRIESASELEAEQWAAFYARLEANYQARAARWANGHAPFSAAGVDPGSVADTVAGPDAKGGYPWEGPRFSFSLLLGEGRVWDGPRECFTVRENDGDGPVTKVFGVEVSGPTACRCRGIKVMDVGTVCLDCCRSGRDLVIPKGEPRPSRKRMPEKAGKLKGGMAGKT